MSKKDDHNVILPGPLCRTEYAELYKALDALLDNANHGQNFVLPDFKGMFINGWKEEDNG